MLAKIRAVVGNLWGATSTIVLSVGVAVMAFAAENPQAITPEIKRGLFWLGLAVAILRAVAPPPPKAT